MIIDKQDVVYFDYPLHLNVGDLLIYAGTEQFFKDYDIRIRLRRSLQAFDIDEAKKIHYTEYHYFMSWWGQLWRSLPKHSKNA